MKKVKIIIGFLLLYGAGSEYINASHQLLSYWNPGILTACLIIIVIATWLIGSGMSQEKLDVKSFKIIKYFALSLLLFIVVAFVGLISYKAKPELVIVNGTEVNIAEMMNGTKRLVPDEQQRKAYCMCIVEKLTADKKIVQEYKDELKSGKMDDVLKEVAADAKFNLNECASFITELEWTPEFEKGVREKYMDQLRQSEFSKTNDLDNYCDCLIIELKKLPVKIISSSDFFDSYQGQKADSVCKFKSKLH